VSGRRIHVVTETDDSVPESVRHGLVAEAARLARLLRASWDIFLLGAPGPALERAASALAVCGTVHVVRDPAFEPYEARPWAEALRALFTDGNDLVLLAATPIGRDLAPQLAFALGAGLVADCVNVEVGDDEEPHFARLVCGGHLQATLAFAPRSRIVATLCPQRLPEPATAARSVIAPSVAELPVLPSPRVRRVAFRQVASDDVSLPEAEVVVGAGRGLGGPDGVELARELAQCLSGTLAATRPVVDAGWLPYDVQVGQTGKTIGPRLYLACGVSGAIHHTVGIKDAAVVVALNTDRSAAIFRVADMGFVGDALAVLPHVVERLRARRCPTSGDAGQGGRQVGGPR
jgi:electron transfer flavoprotein alpha subunit